MIATRYGVQHVEIQQTHFRSTEPSYLQEFATGCNGPTRR